MGDKRQKNQMELAFTWGGRGEAPSETRKGTETSLARHESERLAESEQLMEKVCEPKNLKQALKRVKANGGSPGIDGMRVEELGKWLIGNWEGLREKLLNGRYEPKPVKRVEIAKPDGGTRKLGVPTVIDRFVQQAALQVLQRSWEPTFSESSYGFRSGRSAHGAVEKAQSYVAEGRRWVIDIDLEKFFDTVHQDRLMARMATRIKDKRMLRLVRGFLKSGVLEGGLVSPTEEGTPQGGPLSPLLSNIVLDELDRELEKRGHKFVRYADDCNVYVKSERAGQRVMASLRRLLTTRLRLKINENKSAVGKPYQRKFLGFSFTSHRTPKRRIAPQALERFKKRIRTLTRRMRGRTLSSVIGELNSYLNGWRGYFGFCETPSVLRELDGWIRRRLRCYLWKQWKKIGRRRTELLRLNAPPNWARNLAVSSKGAWHLSAIISKFLPPEFFDSLHLVRLARPA